MIYSVWFSCRLSWRGLTDQIPQAIADGFPIFGSKEYNNVADKVIHENPQEAMAVAKYAKLQRHIISNYNPKEISEKRNDIISKEIRAAKEEARMQNIDALDLASGGVSMEESAKRAEGFFSVEQRPKVSFAEKLKDKAQQSFAEKMVSPDFVRLLGNLEIRGFFLF